MGFPVKKLEIGIKKRNFKYPSKKLRSEISRTRICSLIQSDLKRSMRRDSKQIVLLILIILQEFCEISIFSMIILFLFNHFRYRWISSTHSRFETSGRQRNSSINWKLKSKPFLQRLYIFLTITNLSIKSVLYRMDTTIVNTITNT